MKKIILILALVGSSLSHAMSDFDRAVLFGANAASMGVYIAQMEAEIAKVQLNYEKQLAEFNLTLEKDHQNSLKKDLEDELGLLERQQLEYSKIFESLKYRNDGFNRILDLLGGVYRGKIKTESILVELDKLNKIYPTSHQDFSELVQGGLRDIKSLNITSDKFEPILANAAFIYANSKAMQEEIAEQISAINTRKLDIKSQLEKIK